MLESESKFCGLNSVSVEHSIATQTCVYRPTTIKTLTRHVKSYGKKLYNRGLWVKDEEELEAEIEKRINRTYNISRLI